MEPISIGLAGPKESGKSTAAKILVDKFNMVKVAFADAVKHEVAEVALYGREIPVELVDRAQKEPLLEKLVWDLKIARNQKSRKKISIAEEEIEVYTEGLDPFYKPTGPFCREILQLWGTEFRRAQDDLYWVNRTRKAANDILASGFSVVCDDVRFRDNEAPIFNYVWYMLNDKAETAKGNHPSENSIGPEDCHKVIDNNGPVAMLQFQINILMEEILNHAK